MNTSTKLILVCTFAFCTAGMRAPVPLWAMPNTMPVERVIANLNRQIEVNPDDATAFMNLGRAHSYVYQIGADSLAVGLKGAHVDGERDSPITVADMRTQRMTRPGKATLAEEPRLDHLNEAVKAFSRAIELREGFVEAHLGLADVLRAGIDDADSASELPSPAYTANSRSIAEGWEHSLNIDSNVDIDSIKYALRKLTPYDDEKGTHGEVQRPTRLLVELVQSSRLKAEGDRKVLLDETAIQYWRYQIAEHYLMAFMLSYPTDAHREYQPALTGLGSLIAYEAGKGYLRAIDQYGEMKADRPRIKVVKAGLAALEDLKVIHAVTPIIFSLSAPATLESLLAPETVVHFDLDGTGREQSWPWVSPEASILVWDPEDTGEVASGRQLFGSVTWWLFFDDGYRAMDALDDNRDGELAGDELAGLGVWTDANSNGVSDPGEVVPIAEAGIEAISCRQTDTTMGMPANLTGLRMTDGRVLPTYDWVATEVPQEPTETVEVGS